MTERVRRLRTQSLDATPTISAERAALMTRVYQEHSGKCATPVLRALAYKHLCEHQTIYIGDDELIVGERGPEPKATPTFPELTCHSLQDLRTLNERPKTSYAVNRETIQTYETSVIPFWTGRSLRDRIFRELPSEWHRAYEAGVFTEFMEQRAPGHTVADGKIYRKGMRDFQRDVTECKLRLDDHRDPLAFDKRQQLEAMHIAAEGLIIFAQRHADLAEQMAARTDEPRRRDELERIAQVCRRVPAEAPRDFHEALQMYWFCHLGVITELNGWDSFNPGHLDQHLQPFYAKGLDEGTLTRDSAKELLACWWIKFNNHPAPPKVGVTAAESGTYTDFANINIGGLLRTGEDAVSDVSYLLLETIDEVHTLQPSTNVQVSRKTPERFLRAACRVIRQGYGFPSVFNADAVVEELLRQGKSVEDAREGGTSGCVETGAFGKEAYVLTGYFNLVKVLEITLNNGFDPRTATQVGPKTGEANSFTTFEDLFAAWRRQIEYFIDIKIAGSRIIERMYASEMPAPFLSLLIDDCVENGLDYNAGGARYNTSYIQGVGIGSMTDCLAAIRRHVYDRGTTTMEALAGALDADFAEHEPLRQLLVNKSPKYGNDDDNADELMTRCFDVLFDCVDGRPTARGGTYHVNMLSTTCHVYFGSVTGATPDGRRAGLPISDGISPVQGADRLGPTAVVRSAGKMDHVKTGGTLLNLKFSPQVLAGDDGIQKLASLIRAYFRLDGHHIQFNVINAATLREAQDQPDAHRHLIVRVAGYSDYFVDVSRELQEEIIARTEHGEA